MTVRNVYVDVQNTLKVPFVSGIQRVVKELLGRLTQRQAEINVIPVIHCPFCQGWRRLSDSETRAIRSFDSGGNSLQVGNRTVRDFVTKLIGRNGTVMLRRCWDWYGHSKSHMGLRLPEFEPGSVFLDLEASWHNPLPRSSLLPALKRSGIRLVTFHYDIVPILFPEKTHRDTIGIFKSHLHAHLMNSDLFICISKQVERDLQIYASQCTDCSKPNTVTIALGSDTFDSDATTCEWPLPPGLKRFLLCVGTIEPRKNHQALLDAFDNISSDYVDLGLVIVGRAGWQAETITERIKSHSLYKTRLFWLSNVDNGTLVQLYKQAFVNVVASAYEGFGLPVTEALRHGCVTLSSNAGALPEAGRQLVEYFDPNDRSGLVFLLRKYLSCPAKHERRLQAVQASRMTSWDQTAEQLSGLLR